MHRIRNVVACILSSEVFLALQCSLQNVIRENTIHELLTTEHFANYVQQFPKSELMPFCKRVVFVSSVPNLSPDEEIANEGEFKGNCFIRFVIDELEIHWDRDA